jgi:hypothetical protein
MAQTGDAGAGGVCFDAGREGIGGRGARPPASSTRGVYFVLDHPSARTGWWTACGRKHDTDLEAEVFGFELARERGPCRRRDAPKVLDVGAARNLPRGLDVLGVGPPLDRPRMGVLC